MIGRSFFDVVTDERLRHWLFERNFAGRCNYTSKAGLDLDVSVVAPDSRHMMIVTHDVTERLRIDEMRRDFVANVSHNCVRRSPSSADFWILSLREKCLQTSCKSTAN